MAEETEMTAPPSSIHDLRPKMKLTGHVTKVDLYGAFVDIGIGRDALVHISKMKRGAVNRVEEILSVGDEVTVYIDRIDPDAGRVSLTMIKPLDVTWNDLKPGQVYTGTITRLEPYGAFVDIGAERAGMVHVSEMGDDLGGRPNEVFSLGQELEVKVVNFDRRKRRIDLSLSIHASIEEIGDEAGEELPTEMEMALRKALEGSDIDFAPPKTRGRRPRSRRRRRHVQDDLLNRTLQNRKS
jgi:ribosomal protein S1